MLESGGSKEPHQVMRKCQESSNSTRTESPASLRVSCRRLLHSRKMKAIAKIGSGDTFFRGKAVLTGGIANLFPRKSRPRVYRTKATYFAGQKRLYRRKKATNLLHDLGYQGCAYLETLLLAVVLSAWGLIPAIFFGRISRNVWSLTGMRYSLLADHSLSFEPAMTN